MDHSLALAFYGDDFTGSTDALEFLSRAGLRTALFIEPPTPERLATYPNLDAIGVAGLTRSMPPESCCWAACRAWSTTSPAMPRTSPARFFTSPPICCSAALVAPSDAFVFEPFP